MSFWIWVVIIALFIVLGFISVGIVTVMQNVQSNYVNMARAAQVFEAERDKLNSSMNKVDQVHHHLRSHDRRIIAIEKELSLRR